MHIICGTVLGQTNHMAHNLLGGVTRSWFKKMLHLWELNKKFSWCDSPILVNISNIEKLHNAIV